MLEQHFFVTIFRMWILVTFVRPYVISESKFEQLNSEEVRVSIPDDTAADAKSICEKSVTSVLGKLAECRNRLVFEEKFDKDIDSEDDGIVANSSWTREIFMPLNPDYEFCAYRELTNNLKFENGIVRIIPLITDEVYGENATLIGRLDLSDSCTRSLPLECKRRAIGHSILPPVISTRLTTRKSFYFRYGKIEIRAKFPKGDWLYPELYLEPMRHIRDTNYSKGRVILGLSRGNERSNYGNAYDSTNLEFGLRTGPNDRVREDKVTKRRVADPWYDDYHVYTTIWDEKGFSFRADDDLVGRIEPQGWSNRNHFLNGSVPIESDMAPYDKEFYISVGLGVGGVRVFPDVTMSERRTKPWRNIEAKAMWNFWKAREAWLPSWRGVRNNAEDSHMQLDYIRVWTI